MSTEQKVPFVIAHEWKRNGDHPHDYAKTTQGLEGGELRDFTGAERQALGWEGGVVRYFRHPEVSGDTICPHCGRTMHDHGWLDEGAADPSAANIVCPGGWVLSTPEGYKAITTAEYLDALSKGEIAKNFYAPGGYPSC